MMDRTPRPLMATFGVIALLAHPGTLTGEGPTSPPTRIGVYESEANEAVYHGAHQTPLRSWLGRNGYPFEVIGDRQAASPAVLARFAAVITTSCYVVPDAACLGLASYVRGGGHLIWIDGPARCNHKDLLRVLGVEPDCTYTPFTRTRFTLLDRTSFLCLGVSDSDERITGNPATKACGRVLAVWSPAAKEGTTSSTDQKGRLPAVVATSTGKGQAILLNCIPWLGRAQQVRAVLTNALEQALADSLMASGPCIARFVGVPAEVTQPSQIPVSVRILGKPELAGKTTIVTLSLLGAQNRPTGRTTSISGEVKPTDPGEPSCMTARAALPTRGLPDGDYQIAAEGRVGDQAVPQARRGVKLNGGTLARLAAAEAERFRVLRPVFRGILGDYDAEPRTKAGRVDMPRLFQQIEAAHMTMYDFLIWHAKTDWEDFQIFAAQAHKRGLKVWITLAPPSEPPASAPFGLDFLRWADEVGKLSRKYDNIVGMVIDDFWSGGNERLFTPSYIARLAAILREHNPRLAFLPVIYWGTVGNVEFMRDYGCAIDGIVFPYADLVSTRELSAQLSACRRWLGPNKLLLINVYASGSSGTGEKGPRTPEYIRDILTVSHQMCDGIRIYCLPKADFADYRFAITAELFAKWRAEQ